MNPEDIDDVIVRAAIHPGIGIARPIGRVKAPGGPFSNLWGERGRPGRQRIEC
jgi:hypothetical protein